MHSEQKATEGTQEKRTLRSLHLWSFLMFTPLLTKLTAFISTDLLGLPRALDGNGVGIARADMGAYEFNPVSVRANPEVDRQRARVHDPA